MKLDSIAAERDLIADIEMLASALSASLSETQAIKLLANRSSTTWREHFSQFSSWVERDGIALSIKRSKQLAAHPAFDIVLELIAIEARFGNSSLASSLNNYALRLRKSLAIKMQVIERINAVRNVAKIALLAPWLVLIVLCSRRETLDAFVTAQGLAVLATGLTLCTFAYLLMNRLSRLKSPPRMFAN